MDSVPNRTTQGEKVAEYSQWGWLGRGGDNLAMAVIIANYNGAATIGRCLASLQIANKVGHEIIVVDDCSTDNSVAIIKAYPCRLIQLNRQRGAAAARNIGAAHSRADTFFFTDADCLVRPDTLALAAAAIHQRGAETIIGGSYTTLAADGNFFSTFQSLFIHYSELKNAAKPDYIATHAMVIAADTFRRCGGFKEDFLPILEDVEFSHRARRQGCKLEMAGGLMVRHIFNYSLARSLTNAYKKSRYWTIYSLANKDICHDSGTASLELKLNVALFCALLALLAGWLAAPALIKPNMLPLAMAVNIISNRRLFNLFRREAGLKFCLAAALYYMLIYPLAVGAGALAGIWHRQEINISGRAKISAATKISDGAGL